MSNIFLHILGGSTANDTFGINGQKVSQLDTMSAQKQACNFFLYVHVLEHLVGQFEIDTAKT